MLDLGEPRRRANDGRIDCCRFWNGDSLVEESIALSGFCFGQNNDLGGHWTRFLKKMLEAGITYLDMDLLLYTHIHPDHVADLVPLLFACKYADQPRKKI